MIAAPPWPAVAWRRHPVAPLAAAMPMTREASGAVRPLESRDLIPFWLSPIPGEATGFLGGYLFGEALGLLYSTIGLTLGSVAAFAIGRWLGAHYVQNFVKKETWDKLGFIVEAEGAILCFMIFLIPGLPKDIVCYLFGISPMPILVFAVVSGLGRIPGTWVLSAQGAHTATGNYVYVIVITAIVVAVALPLYYYRNRIVTWFHGKNSRPAPR